MKIKLIYLFPLVFSSCDLSDYQTPALPKHQTNEEGSREPETQHKPFHKEKKGILSKVAQQNRQNPDKNFRSVTKVITRGQPIHSFPKEK